MRLIHRPNHQSYRQPLSWVKTWCPCCLSLSVAIVSRVRIARLFTPRSWIAVAKGSFMELDRVTAESIERWVTSLGDKASDGLGRDVKVSVGSQLPRIFNTIDDGAFTRRPFCEFSGVDKHGNPTFSFGASSGKEHSKVSSRLGSTVVSPKLTIARWLSHGCVPDLFQCTSQSIRTEYDLRASSPITGDVRMEIQLQFPRLQAQQRTEKRLQRTPRIGGHSHPLLY